MNKGILYYTDNQLKTKIARRCRKYISKAGIPITSVSLKPTNFGTNIHLQLERGYETMFRQILTGLESMKEDVIYFCEHDILYHPDHFNFIPEDRNVFYYNGNYWNLRLRDGFAVHYNVSPLSGLVGYREALLTHFKERMELIEREGFSRKIGFEPMTHHRIQWDDWFDYEIFIPEHPNIELCHSSNATWKRWKKEDFRRKPTFWEESDINNIPGWPDLPIIVKDFFPLDTEEKKEDSKKVVNIVRPAEDLSVLIPARNEMFLSRTIDDILEHAEGNTEVIVGLDGSWATPPIKDHPKVTIVHVSESIGQRAMTNQLCRLSKAKYVVKVDAHCAFDQGFDVKLMAKMQDDWTMVPIMRNLHAFDWVCKKCGARKYQGPTPDKCWGEGCVGTEFDRDIKWIGKENPQSTSYLFDTEPHFQYFKEYRDRDEYKNALEKYRLTDTLSLQGSFFMMTRDKYWELNICDESFGSWGSQGIEVAVKTWLSGGRVVCNHDTWYAHMFRTQGGDFGFPYKLSGKQVKHAKTHAKEVFFNNKWVGQKHSLRWLLEKFWPVPHWTEDNLNSLGESF